MSETFKKKLAIIVGSGFSAGFTSGIAPPIGNRPMPTLSELSGAMLTHMTEITKSPQEEVPFLSETIEATISILEKNENLPENVKYDFEQLISLLSIKSFLSSSVLSRIKQRHYFENNPGILQCLIYFIPSLFAKHLSIDGKLAKNRNLFYSVKDRERVRVFQDHIRHLVSTYDVTFISFNYDGLLEAFLDCKLSEEDPPIFHYYPEISHGIPMSMPENVLGSFDSSRLHRLLKFTPPLVLKPHGSMHFHQLKEEVRRLTNTPSLVAVQPRFDIGFNQNTMQRDIPDVPFWKYAEYVPFIIPPVFNKESFLSSDYSKVILDRVLQTLSDAQVIMSFGFSIPRSDLHVSALFGLAAQTSVNWPKKIGLVYKSGPNDQTMSNWTRIFGSENVKVIDCNGLPVSSMEAISSMWERISDLISQ